jgi:hypothetical protein
MPPAMTVERLYEQHIRQLSMRDRLRLMALVANDLTSAPEEAVVHRVSPRLAHPEQAGDFVMECGPSASR